jgi:hypothetical protein
LKEDFVAEDWLILQMLTAPHISRLLQMTDVDESLPFLKCLGSPKLVKLIIDLDLTKLPFLSLRVHLIP